MPVTTTTTTTAPSSPFSPECQLSFSMAALHPLLPITYRTLDTASTAGGPPGQAPRHVLHLAHIHHGANAIPAPHGLKRLIDLPQRLPVRDELVHLELPLQVVAHQVGQLAAALDAAEGAAAPHAARHELEGPRAD